MLNDLVHGYEDRGENMIEHMNRAGNAAKSCQVQTRQDPLGHTNHATKRDEPSRSYLDVCAGQFNGLLPASVLVHAVIPAAWGL